MVASAEVVYGVSAPRDNARRCRGGLPGATVLQTVRQVSVRE